MQATSEQTGDIETGPTKHSTPLHVRSTKPKERTRGLKPTTGPLTAAHLTFMFDPQKRARLFFRILLFEGQMYFRHANTLNHRQTPKKIPSSKKYVGPSWWGGVRGGGGGVYPPPPPPQKKICKKIKKKKKKTTMLLKKKKKKKKN